MINEEIKVIECSFDELETQLNELCELSWDLIDWHSDFANRKVLVILTRNLSIESCDWIDRLDKTLDKLSDLHNNNEEDTL